MGGGASRWRRAAKKIGFPCAAFFPIQAPSDQARTISCSAVAAAADAGERKPEEAESTADKNLLCAICLEPLRGGEGGREIFTGQCSHAFHLACIASNVRHGSVTCPICRAHWSHLPRGLRHPLSSSSSSSHPADPILRILDDSIATSRVNRRSSLRAARYNDDDPIDPSAADPSSSRHHHRLRLSLLPQCRRHHHHSTPSAAACLSVRLAPQPQPTDLVLVASPNGPHLRLLKQSMALVVFSLRAADRLAIVTYASSAAAAARAFPLRRMSAHGKRAALQVIDRLSYLGEADQEEEGLRKGVKILEDRAHRNPLACVLHLSDGPTPVGGGDRDRDRDCPVLIHRFHVGFGFGAASGFVMHEFEEFLGRLLGGVVREVQLRIGGEEEEGLVVRLGEIRAGEERRVPLDLGEECEFVRVGYSYVEGSGAEERLRTGEVVVEVANEKSERGSSSCEFEGRDLSSGGRSSCVGVERWDYLDPFMARRWAKHLHGCKA